MSKTVLATKNINDEISWCIIQMLMKEPFFAHLLSGIVRIISKKITTAAVGNDNGNITLFVNEHFFLNELTTFSSRVAIKVIIIRFSFLVNLKFIIFIVL